jgi:hypothetical protein
MSPTILKILEPFTYIFLVYIIGTLMMTIIIKVEDLNSFLINPMDFNLRFKGKRLFGDHKTWRGLVSAVFSVFLTILIIKRLIPNPFDFEFLPKIFNYNIVYISLIITLGYLLGELGNSFIKRQLNIKPGREGNFFQKIIDQTDVFLGSVFLIYIFIAPVPLYFFLYGFIEILIIHTLISKTYRQLGIKK